MQVERSEQSGPVVDDATPAASSPAKPEPERSVPHNTSTMFSDSSVHSDDREVRSRSPSAGAGACGFPLATLGPQGAIGESVGSVGSRALSSASGGRACSPVAAGDWPTELKAIIQKQQQALGRQCRPLIHHSMYTGMNTQAMVFRLAAMDVVDVVGAEKKESARWFMSANRLLPNKLFTCADEMLRESLASTEPGYERADLFTAGFPCQPWSRMARVRFDPPRHKLFTEFEHTMDYILKTEPRACLLENVPPFLDHFVDNGVASSSFEVLTARLGGKYHIAYGFQDLEAWVEIRRRRVFMWCLHHDVADARVPEEVSTLATQIEDERRTFPAARMAHFMFAPGTEEFRSKVLALDRPRGTSGGPGGDKGKAKWRKEAQAIRSALQEAGCAHASAHPLRDASLSGLGATRRQRELLECFLLLHCHHCGVSATCPKQLREAMRGLTCDISQNRHHHAAEGHASGSMASLCTSSIIYSFEHDRLVHEEELLAGMGWQSVTVPQMSRQEIRGLIGESQALPSLAVATWALLLVSQNAIPRLWSGDS